MKTYMRVAITALVTCLNVGCINSECGNELLAEATSPTNAYIATSFLRNCGATTPFVHVVSIRTSQAAFDADDQEAYVFTMQGEHSISVQWEGPTKLIVARPTVPQDVFIQKARWNDVEISAEP